MFSARKTWEHARGLAGRIVRTVAAAPRAAAWVPRARHACHRGGNGGAGPDQFVADIALAHAGHCGYLPAARPDYVRGSRLVRASFPVEGVTLRRYDDWQLPARQCLDGGHHPAHLDIFPGVYPPALPMAFRRAGDRGGYYPPRQAARGGPR